MKGYRLRPWVVPFGLTLITTSMFAAEITYKAYVYRGYSAIGSEWILTIAFAVIVYKLFRRNAERLRRR